MVERLCKIYLTVWKSVGRAIPPWLGTFPFFIAKKKPCETYVIFLTASSVENGQKFEKEEEEEDGEKRKTVSEKTRRGKGWDDTSVASRDLNWWSDSFLFVFLEKKNPSDIRPWSIFNCTKKELSDENALQTHSAFVKGCEKSPLKWLRKHLFSCVNKPQMF